MKNKIIPTAVLALLFSCSFTACKKNAQQADIEGDVEWQLPLEKKDSIQTQVVKEKTTSHKFTSPLRHDEQLKLGTVYTDTITFLNYDDNTDYWYFEAKKNKDTIQIIYTYEHAIPEVAAGDALAIQWELKVLHEAGDKEITYVKPFLVSFSTIHSKQLTDKGITILWRETLYDEALQTDINTIVLNTNYQKKITEPERAALGFIATFVGSECEWDGGNPNATRSNLNCMLLSYLDLGYQCSNTHLDFLKKWFSKDSKALDALKHCPTIPNTATIQSTFDEILMETNTEAQTIVLRYTFNAINVRENAVTSIAKTDTFSYDSGGIVLVDSKKQE